jgi:hypothetical protein
MRMDSSSSFLFLHAIYVDNQQHRPLGGSNGVPPLFASHDAILAEHYLGSLKTSAALSKAMPSCFCWLIRFFSLSHSNRIAIQNV